MSDFDPYQEWLDIPPAEQPPHHYRLLGLPIFEADAAKISAAAEHHMQHVRTFQLGKHSQLSQKVLNQIASAKICLLKTSAKARYDRALAAQLQTRLPAAPPMLPSAAPPLLPPEHDDTLMAVLQEPARATAGNVARPLGQPARSTRSVGPVIVGVVMVVVLVSLIIILASRYLRFSSSGSDGGPAPIVLPESDETARSKLGGKTVVVPGNVVIQSAGRNIDLPLARATVSGPTIKRDAESTANWASPADRVQWEFLVKKPGFFEIQVTYSADAQSAGGTARIELSGQPRNVTLSIRDTLGQFVTDPVKVVMIESGGRYALTIAPEEKRGDVLMNLRSVRLRSTSGR